MRWPVKNRTRAFLLIILAVVVIVDGLRLYLRETAVGETSEQQGMDFLLKVYGEPGGIEFSRGRAPNLPMFDPQSKSWAFDGQVISEFARFVQGLEIGPHGSSPFVIVAIPDNGTVADYRSALASLASHGICRVGVYSPPSNNEFVSLRADGTQPQEIFVPVYHVLSVGRDNGLARDCADRFPPFAPWAS